MAQAFIHPGTPLHPQLDQPEPQQMQHTGQNLMPVTVPNKEPRLIELSCHAEWHPLHWLSSFFNSTATGK